MTFVGVAMLGLGAILIISAVENTSVVQTFQQLIKGKLVISNQTNTTNETTNQTVSFV